MTLKEQLFKDLKPEIESEGNLDQAILHLNNGGRVLHKGQEVTDLHRLSFGQGFGKYKGHISGDWMNGIFILK